MPAGAIITVLSNLPWGQVLDAAPKVADGATKLWNAVLRRKKGDAEDETTLAESGASDTAGVDPLVEVRAQVASIEVAVCNLKDEMQAATEIIKQLAEQNAVLVQRVELNRLRLVRQAIAWAVVSAMLLAGLLYLLIKA